MTRPTRTIRSARPSRPSGPFWPLLVAGTLFFGAIDLSLAEGADPPRPNLERSPASRSTSAPEAATHNAARGDVHTDAHGDIALSMRHALEEWLRWNRVPEVVAVHLGDVLEGEVNLRAHDQHRPRAAADLSAWLQSSAWRVPSITGAPIDSPKVAVAASVLRDAVARWAATPDPSPADRLTILAEEQAMLESTLAAAQRFAARHGLDEASIDRLRRRIARLADQRRGQRGNPFFPEWRRPRTVEPMALAERLARSLDGNALLEALGDRAAIELRLLEGDPRTARFRRLLVDAQIDAAANRLDEIVGLTLDETAPEEDRDGADSWRGIAGGANEAPAADRPARTVEPDERDPRTFDSIVEELLAAPPSLDGPRP
jgi:hypothetical protein